MCAGVGVVVVVVEVVGGHEVGCGARGGVGGEN